jgi:hypothetical protein
MEIHGIFPKIMGKESDVNAKFGKIIEYHYFTPHQRIAALRSQLTK